MTPLIQLFFALISFNAFAGVTEGKFCNGSTQTHWYCGGYPKGEAWIPQGNMCFHRDTLFPCEKGENDITIGKVVNYGMSRGCQAGSYSVTPSPDNNQISVIFENYNLTYDSSLQEWLDPFYYNRDCSLLIPVKIPKGHQIAIEATDFRGFFDIPAGGKFSFWSSLKYSDDYNEWVENRQNWNETRKDFSGPLSQEFMVELEEKNQTWSECGEELYIWVSSGFNLFSNQQREQVLASVDSMDIQMRPGVNVKLDIRKCR